MRKRTKGFVLIGLVLTLGGIGLYWQQLTELKEPLPPTTPAEISPENYLIHNVTTVHVFIQTEDSTIYFNTTIIGRWITEGEENTTLLFQGAG